MVAIEIKKLKKYYGNARGLEDATFSVEQGKIFGFVGPNGAGKTTLIRILLGLIYKTSGEVKINGQDPSTNADLLNHSIGYLPSEAFFFPEMKVRDVLAFYGNMRNVDKARVEELIIRFDLDINKKIQELSFGNKKKVGIIVSLMHSPSLLILDEPTTGLDPLMQQTFLDLLLEEKKKGVTVFLSSHILSEVEKICDQVALIRDGEIKSVFEMKDFNPDAHKKLVIKPDFSLPTIKGLEFNEEVSGAFHYQYSGDVNKLVQFLGKMKFESITLRDASLEEIVITYYQKAGVINDIQ